MFRPLIKKVLRPLKSPVISLTRRLLEASGVEGQLEAIIRQLHDLKKTEQIRTIGPDSRLHATVPVVLSLARQVRSLTGHPLAQDLDAHYSYCADMLTRHGKELDVATHMMFKEDDWSLDYVKSLGLYVPGNEAAQRAGCGEYPLMGLLDDPDCAVFLVTGQSNAANHGDAPYQPKSDVYTLNFMNMRCYKADDPLCGASGMGGSIWSRFGDYLISEGIYKRVLFVPLAFGGTFARDWIQGGNMARRLDLCLNRLYKAVGGILPISAVIWQQGEAEANSSDMSSEAYAEHVQCLVASLRERFVVAPVFVAVTTLCACNSPAFDNARQIREGQRNLVRPDLGILAGPDLDRVGVDERYDACHLSASGLEHCARLWGEVIKEARPVLTKPRLGA